MTLGLSVAVLVYLAFLLSLCGFLARDELLLRLLMLCATSFYMAYYYSVGDAPLWDALFANTALLVVNLVMIAIVLAERTTFAMSRETEALYAQFKLLTPGQFRRLLRHGKESTATQPTLLVREGAPVERLYFLTNGTARVNKNENWFTLEPGNFVGELGFLTGNAASASVEVAPGARYVSWDSAGLSKLFRKNAALRNAVMAQFNQDIARKLAGSVPMAQSAWNESTEDAG